MPQLTDPLKNKPEFFAINGLRFLAAAWVLLFHISIHFGKLDFLSSVQPVIDQGVLAMTLFFMLSGFILSYRYRSFSQPQDTQEYLAARIARLYPVYIFMGLTTLWRLGDGANQFYLIERFKWLGAVPFTFAAIALFIVAGQAWFPSLFCIWNFGGSWSLSVESFFYTLFPKLRNDIGKLGDRALAVTTLALPVLMGTITIGLIVSYTKENNTSQIFYVLPIFRLPEFLFGVCGYVLFVDRRLFRKALAYSGVASAGVLCGGIYWRDLPGAIDWGPFATFAFMSGFVFCLNANAPNFIKLSINYLGRLSYCLYMAQFTTIPLLKKFEDLLTLEHAWALACFSTLVLAMLTYHFVEVLAYSKTKKLTVKVVRRVWSYLQVGVHPNEAIDATTSRVNPASFSPSPTQDESTADMGLRIKGR